MGVQKLLIFQLLKFHFLFIPFVSSSFCLFLMLQAETYCVKEEPLPSLICRLQWPQGNSRPDKDGCFGFSSFLSFFLSVVCSFPPRLCFVFQRLPVALPVHWNAAQPFLRRLAKEFLFAAHPLPCRCLRFALDVTQVPANLWKFQPGFSGFQQKYPWIYNSPPSSSSTTFFPPSCPSLTPPPLCHSC